MTERSHILNAFRPNAEIKNPVAFAGRVNQIEELTDSLVMDGSLPVIYGGRGLGKTSIALQMARIALGDDTLLKMVNSEGLKLSEDSVLVPFWVSCSDEVKSKDQLLDRIINCSVGIRSLEDLNNQNQSATTQTPLLQLKDFEAIAIDKYETNEKRTFSKLSSEERFLAVLNVLADKGINKVLFIIDELDRVTGTKGFSAFLKNTNNSNIKFMLVGIANTISTLLDDHESLQRSLHPIKVTQMNTIESKEIITKSISILASNNININFTEQSINKLTSIASGYPWFIHILSQESLRRCWDKGRKTVTIDDVNSAITKLAANRFAQQYSDSYQVAVRDSRQREQVLRLMAKWSNDDVPLSEIYRVAKTQLQIANPSNYKADLMLKRNGAIIVSPPLHQKGVIRFKDSMFKKYINLRRAIYNGVKTEVDEAWKNR